jgi:endonuclease/exonuclease/phosphatase family metal-dependent hydrolase
VRLLSYNIRQGGSGRAPLIAEVISRASPDIVILQEATRAEVVTELGQRLSMQAECGEGQSLGFLSRLPIAHYAWHQPRISRHAFLEVQPQGTEFRIFGLHLSAVHAAWTEHRRTLELRALLRAIAAHQHGVHVLTGDFNTLAPGEYLDIRKLPPRLRALVWLSGGRIRWRTIRRVLDAGYVDAFRTLHPDAPGPTFPVWDPHIRLDYLFLPSAARDALVASEVVMDGPVREASDHLPLLTELAIVTSSQPAAASSRAENR